MIDQGQDACAASDSSYVWRQRDGSGMTWRSRAMPSGKQTRVRWSSGIGNVLLSRRWRRHQVDRAAAAAEPGEHMRSISSTVAR